VHAVAPVTTTLTMSSPTNPGFGGLSGDNSLIAVASGANSPYEPTGLVNFTSNSSPIAGCQNVPLQVGLGKSTAICHVTGLALGNYAIGASYGGDAYNSPATGAMTLTIVPSTPGIAFVNSNTTGALNVTGATYMNGTVTNFSDDTLFDLGPNPGELFLQMDSLRLGPNVKLRIRANAVNQIVRMLVDAPSGPASIAGTLRGEAGSLSPIVIIDAPGGLNVHSTGTIEVVKGLTVDLLTGSYTIGKDLQNNGAIDGGDKFEAYAWSYKGAGEWSSWDTRFHFYGNANNPVNNNFLNNGLNLYPSAIAPPPPPPPPPNRVGPDGVAAAAPFRVTLNAYSTVPQFINLKLYGDASVWMPSAWPAGTSFPQNNAVVAPTGSRPAGTPEPAYGGGSMIIHATGSLSFFDGGPTGTKDFVFPGAMVFISDVAIDLAGVTLNQGWTTTGRAFQGIFLEAPSITSSVGTIKLFSNDLNWTNFSILPMKSVAVSRLTLQPNGSASFTNADLIAPHLNTYSTIAATAASGGCWVCLVNTVPVDMTHLP
jgi:hypothetical protein